MHSKTVADSASTMSALMLPHQANPAGNVHGGEIMKMMDEAAGAVAVRHSRSNVVTARVDELSFHEPIRIGNWVSCKAKLTFVGRSSMEVSVIVEVENLRSDAPAKIALSGYFTLVALDKDGHPTAVPSLQRLNAEEELLYHEGLQRYQSYKQKKLSGGQ